MKNFETQGSALVKRIAVITHRRSDATSEAILQVLGLARGLSIEVVVPEREVEKNPAVGRGLAEIVPTLADARVDFCVALGGDGTILRAFSHFRNLETPILGVNFGRMGFLSAIGREQIDTLLPGILRGGYDLVELSLVGFTRGGESHLAVNDVVVQKPDGGSVVHLAYRINGVAMDSLRCDGLVVSTPAGSTAYNLSAGGPLVSLSLECFVLTAIAPHTLRFRALVLGPDDELEIVNESLGAAASIYVDGRQKAGLDPGEGLSLGLSGQKAKLVQTTGAEFYRKLRDKFIAPPDRPELKE